MVLVVLPCLTELRRGERPFSPGGINIGEPCCPRKRISTDNSGGGHSRQSLGVICINRWVLSKSQKSFWFIYSLPFWCQWNNKKKFSFSNTQPLISDCGSLFELNFPDILPLRETNLEKSVDCRNLFVRGYPAFIRIDSVTHKHDLVLCAEDVLPFPCDSFLEKYGDSYLCFRITLLHSVTYCCILSFFFIFSFKILFFCTQILVLFHQTFTRFHQSVPLQMDLSLDTLTSIRSLG